MGECAAKGPLIRGAPAEIGYGLAPRVRGRGYGRRMVAELVSILQGVGVSEIRAQTSADNIASRRVLERAGFQIVVSPQGRQRCRTSSDLGALTRAGQTAMLTREPR